MDRPRRIATRAVLARAAIAAAVLLAADLPTEFFGAEMNATSC